MSANNDHLESEGIKAINVMHVEDENMGEDSSSCSSDDLYDGTL